MHDSYNTSVDALRKSGALVRMAKGAMEITSEASELGLPPGQWPTNVQVLVGGHLHTLNHQGYDRSFDNEIQGVRYATQDKMINMLIIND